ALARPSCHHEHEVALAPVWPRSDSDLWFCPTRPSVQEGLQRESPMRDPHVVALTYGLITDATTTYKDPPPVSFPTTLARFELKDGVITVTMNEHFASAA